MEYIATVEALGSLMDRNGNRYWAMVYTDQATGHRVVGTISGGESNIRYAFPGMLFICLDVPIRKFNRMTKDWPYAGCTGEQLRAFVADGLKRQSEL